MPEPVACLRHPNNQTRLRCSVCEDPICPQCLVQTAVGQKCPRDAKQAKTTRALGKPQQLAKAAGAGAAAAVLGAVLLTAIIRSTGGFFVLLLSFLAGSMIGQAVRRGGEGNGGPRFRAIALGASGAMMVLVWAVGIGVLIPSGLLVLSYPAAIYGASTRFPWA